MGPYCWLQKSATDLTKRAGKKCPGGSFLCWVGFGRNQLLRDAQLQSPLESAGVGGGGELVPGAPADIKILGCSSLLYKRVKYSEYSLPYLSPGFAFVDSTSRTSIGHIRQCLGRICGCETRGLGLRTVFSLKKKPFLNAGHLGLLKSWGLMESGLLHSRPSIWRELGTFDSGSLL